MTFLHTADLHLGRAFKSIGGEAATNLVSARFQVLEAIARQVTASGAAFVAIAGDLFDSKNPDGKTLADALQAIGKLGVPVYAIPGNHDPGGPYGPYESRKFEDYRERYAPNFHLLTEPQPLVLDEHGVVLLPCPATGRPGSDPTAWLRDGGLYAGLPPELPRVALAHGGTVDFPSDVDQAAEISLYRLPRAELDYVALGDWHGTLHVTDVAYRYSGTPEADRFPKHPDYRNGLVLAVTPERGGAPAIVEHLVGRYAWVTETRALRSEADIQRLDDDLLAVAEQKGRLLKLVLAGSLGIEAFATLQDTIERLRDVYLHADIDRSGLVVAPGEEELASLAANTRDPTVATVAQKLTALLEDENKAPAARLALVKLYEATR